MKRRFITILGLDCIVLAVVETSYHRNVWLMGYASTTDWAGRFA